MPFSNDLTSPEVDPRALRPGLRLSPLQPTAAKVTEAEIDHVIAQTLQQNRQIEARAAMPEIAGQDELLGLAGRNARRDAARQGEADARLSAATRSTRRPAAPPVEDLTGRRRPSRATLRRVALIAAAVGFIYMWPWFIPLTLFVAFWVVLIVCAMGAGERIGDVMIRGYLWLDARNPDRAERLRQRADRAAMRIDALLDRLPDRWTEGLYMPDLSRAALIPQEFDDRPDPFDRIAAEAQQV